MKVTRNRSLEWIKSGHRMVLELADPEHKDHWIQSFYPVTNGNFISLRCACTKELKLSAKAIAEQHVFKRGDIDELLTIVGVDLRGQTRLLTLQCTALWHEASQLVEKVATDEDDAKKLTAEIESRMTKAITKAIEKLQAEEE